ncbi:IS1182 family transposase [Synechococcus sp. BA-124 BA4]|uniref:IS1182 family transposase n=1 Tax=unclassified Synechococcus TaxID=2626047 RepID=UPI002AD45FDE|nr:MULTISPECIES: IS1182 family transposase [unclassified Synechococcus]MEA5398628.1 IS1182 family transposase [Synechococcus sp. BA-124 BA4]CAK6694705.1 IS1182 family transposase ISStsp11 [Synechococcus sp. CBW1107]
MVKPKSFRPWNPEQTLLLPPSPVEWLPENHLVFFLLDLAAELDLEAIHAVYRQRDPRGEKAYEPRMMVVLLLYAYCVGLPSSRRIEKACWEDAAFRVLTGNQQPDHSRISDFRRRHLAALAGLFVQVLRLCQKAGLVSLGHVALDGTKVRANASRHKAMSHERMLKSEKQLEGEMRALLRKAEIIDAQEDGQYGKGKRGDELPEELQRRSSRLEWIRKAKAELEAEAAAGRARQRDEQAEAAEQEAAEADDSGDEQRSKRAARRARSARKRADDAQTLAIETALAAELESPLITAVRDSLAMPSRQLPTDATGKPKPQAQRNFTDPDSHILKGGEGWIQGYNAQAAVDGDHQVIVAIGVSNQPSDAVHFVPMLERIEANTGQLPEALIADAGYCSTTNLEACEQRSLEAYISTSRQQHGLRPRPSRGPAPRDLDARGRMDRKLRSKAGQAIYALRKTIVEPVFGQIKGARRLDRFRLRGLEMVNGEWALMATTHNLIKLFRASLATG